MAEPASWRGNGDDFRANGPLGDTLLRKEKVNQVIQGLEDYFTPENHTRKLEAESQAIIRYDIYEDFRMLIQ